MARKGRKPSHEEIVEVLYQRLLCSRRYRSVDKHVMYVGERTAGEMDVLAVTNGGILHYYEVKTTHNDRAYARAQKQFSRAYHHFPNTHNWMRFVYVTLDHVKECKKGQDF